MEHYAGIDVSMECSSVCVVNASGKIVREAKVASEPEALIGWFGPLGLGLARIGLEAGPLAQWLYAAMKQALRSSFWRHDTCTKPSSRCR
jgi:transposase